MTSVLFSNNYVGAMYFDAGIAALNRTDFAAAIANFNECLTYTPDDGLAHWYKSLALWATGDYINGAVEHEWRWKLCDWRWGLLGEDIYRVKELPQWQGEDLRGKRVLAYHEQGYGDAIMFLRYLPVMQNMGAKISAVMPQPLQRLTEQLGVEVFGVVPDDLSQFDFRHPLISSMLTLRQTPTNIPNEPYFKAQWRRGHKKMGIIWSGRSRRELTLEKFLSLFDHSGYQLHSLQPGPVPCDDVVPLHADDFADTAKVIEAMDHVVSVDTGVVHLAGAMGHPSVHIVVPWACDWRWYNSKAWYPLMHVYRQPSSDDWATPFAQLSKGLCT